MNTKRSYRQPEVVRYVSRRDVLRLGGLFAVGAVALPPVLAACGGSSSDSPTATATSANPTAGVPTVTAPAGSVTAGSIDSGPVTIKAHELDDVFVFDVDKQAVAAGDVTFNFSNTGNLTHELMVYPVQDIAEMLYLRRQGEEVEEDEYIKGMVGAAEEVEPGKSASFTGTLKAGFYELACHVQGKNPDGSTFLHFDRGQTMTLAAVGPGGPSDSILTPSDNITVEMVPGTGDLESSWLLVPDSLMAKSGEVTFNLNNNMDMAHDFVVYPLGNISAFIADRLAGGENIEMIDGQQLAEDLEAGDSISATAELTPGWWIGACFVVSQLPDGTSYVHRDRGQRFTFLVV